MTKPYAIVFAGVPGTSKTIISHYLSCKFSLPIFNNDQLRYEVREDLLVDNINIPEALAEFEGRLAKRREEILKNQNSIIFDGSVDRRWAEIKKRLGDAGYKWFMVDMELTRPFVENLYNKTGRNNLTTTYLDRYFPEHEEFMNRFADDITVRVTDDTFKDRLQVCAKALEKFIDSL